MRHRFIVLIAASCLLGSLAQAAGSRPQRPRAPAATTEGVTGQDVTRVAFTLAGAPRAFTQVESGEWMHARVAYRETGRDEWSVYLESADGQRVQLDLWAKQVKWSGARSGVDPITSATRGPRRRLAAGGEAEPAPEPVPEPREAEEPPVPQPEEAGSEGVDDSGRRVFYEDVPDMPDEDLAAVLRWIEVETTGVRLPFCWRQSYGNGVGVPLSTCPPGLEKDGLLCYPPCEPGYTGVGPVCWQDCPPGFRDDGAFCAKPAPYGRGVGRVPDVTCPAGFSQQGIGAAAWCDNGPTWPWNLETRAATVSCREDEEMNGGLCYPKCQPHHHAVGCCTCSPDCPSDMGADMGVSCTKKSYGRGAGEPMTCAEGLEEDAGLCYAPCEPRFHLVGPVCWQDCPPGWQGCGAGCSRNADPILGVEAPWRDCATTITDQTLSVFTLAANVATLGLAAPQTAAARAAGQTVQVGGKTLRGTSRVGKSLVTLVNKLQTVRPDTVARDATVVRRIQAARFGKLFNKVKTTKDVASNLYEIEQQFVTAFAEDFAQQTSPEIAREIDSRLDPVTALHVKKTWGGRQLATLAGTEGWQAVQSALSLLSIADISGVTGVVAAYAHPTCRTHEPFPALSRDYR